MIECMQAAGGRAVNILHGWILKESKMQDKAENSTPMMKVCDTLKEFNSSLFHLVYFKQMLTCCVSANAPVNSNHSR